MKEKLCKHILIDKSLSSLAYNLVGQKKKDLLQELGLIVCEKTDKELQELESYFNFWCVRTMINMTGKRGSFTKLYSPKRLNYEDVKFESELEYDYESDASIERIKEILNEIDDGTKRGRYRKTLFEFYLECGSFRKVEKEVGIHFQSVYSTVKEVKSEIKRKI